jgi:hypothetical protein
MTRNPKYDVVQIKDAYDYLMSLEIPSVGNALWDYLHLMIWHQGIDRVDWILSNKELIQEIIKYEWKTQVPEEIDKKVWETVSYYKNLDR